MEPDAGVRAANEALMYDDAKLLVVFCWQSYNLPELLAQIRACSSGVPVIGCTTEVVRGAYGVVGAGVPLVGGCAGDDLKMTRTFQLYDDDVLTDAVVGAPTRGMRGFHNQTLVVLPIS